MEKHVFDDGYVNPYQKGSENHNAASSSLSLTKGCKSTII
jgi:hypothetical protein